MPLIVCECSSPTPSDQAVWVWVFGETARNRLQQRWAGVLSRPEIDELVSGLGGRSSVWFAGIDAYHAPPSKRFRLVCTLPPAPCRIYTRSGVSVAVEATAVTRQLRWRRGQLVVPSASVVEGWIGSDWSYAGISLKGHGGEEQGVLRLKNAGLFMQFLLTYDGIDLMVDTGWLDWVVPRVAEVLGAGWQIVDYTVTPPKIVRQSELAPAPGTNKE